MAASGWSIQRAHDLSPKDLEDLSNVLVDCVEGDASVSFMHPLAFERAVEFWQGIAADVLVGRRALLLARDAGGICGTVQLQLAQPENQPHRADLSKMLVHRRARRLGVGAALLAAAEVVAAEHGKTLLVLDTVVGSEAARLYERIGWICAGVIPDYALMPRGGLVGTAVYYRRLSREA